MPSVRAGKQREEEPLLEGGADTPRSAGPVLNHGRGPLIEDPDDEDDEEHSRPLGRPRRLLTLIGFTIIFSFVILAILAALGLQRIVSEERQRDPAVLVKRGLAIELESVQIIPLANAINNAQIVTLQVDTRLGFDVRKSLAWEDDSNSFFDNLKRRAVRYSMRNIKFVTIHLGTVSLRDRGDHSLLEIVEVAPFKLPISYPSSKGGVVSMDSVKLSIPIAVPTPQLLASTLQRV